jgi:DNA-binding transcriptional ArsR family regulator
MTQLRPDSIGHGPDKPRSSRPARWRPSESPGLSLQSLRPSCHLARLTPPLRPDESFYVRELVRITGVAQGAISGDLEKLAAAGILRRDTRGNQVFYQADAKSPIFGELKSILVKTARDWPTSFDERSSPSDRTILLEIKSLFAVVDRNLAEERAVIENRRPNEYLLPMEHSSGRSKASFFLGLGL